MIRFFSWFRRKPAPACITIGYSGWKTKTNSRVSVGVASPRGLMGVYSYLRTDQSEAMAEMNAKSLAHILGLQIGDRRPAQRQQGA